MSGVVVLDLLIAVALPTAAGYAVVGTRKLLRRREKRRDERTPAARPPLHRVIADLRRLHDALESIENTPDVPAKNMRCQATRAAYVDALQVACAHFDIAPPAGRPVPRAELYRVEAQLRLAGVDVRPIGLPALD